MRRTWEQRSRADEGEKIQIKHLTLSYNMAGFGGVCGALCPTAGSNGGAGSATAAAVEE